MRHAANTKSSYKYKRIHKLGQGNFADVLLVEDLTTNQVKIKIYILKNSLFLS